MTRTKKNIAALTEADFNQSLSRHAEADAKLRKLQATMDVAIQKINDKYKDELERLDHEKSESFDQCMQYAQEHQELFTEKRHISTPFGEVGFRLGTPKLLQKTGFAVSASLDLLRSKFPKFIQTKETINKKAILADQTLTEDDIMSVGLRKVQEDSFYINLKSVENE